MKRISAVLAFLLLGFWVIYSGIYVIPEGEKGLLLHFGVVQPAIFHPGLYFAVPFADRMQKFDLRRQVAQFRSQPIMLKGKNPQQLDREQILVDYYCEWRIADLKKYFALSKNAKWLKEILAPDIEAALRLAFSKQTLPQAIMDQGRELEAQHLASIRKKTTGLGIDVVRVGVIKIDYPHAVSDIIMQRSQASYKQLTEQILAAGNAEAQASIFKTDAAVSRILKEAQIQAMELRSKGNAEAASILDEAYSRDPKFYLWVQSLEAYKKSFAKGGKIIVIQPGSELFKHYDSKNSKGENLIGLNASGHDPGRMKIWQKILSF